MVELAPAVGAGHERLQLQHIVLGSLELFFADYSEYKEGQREKLLAVLIIKNDIC